jgi:disulfide bond formation protein DsbB
MYPLVPILGLAAVRRDRGIRPYAAILAGLGAVIASYHVILERFPTLESNVCDPTTPCTVIWVQRLGYLTIPTMALSGFALVLTLLAVGAPTDLEGEPCQPVQTPARTDPVPAEVPARRVGAGSHRSGSESVSSSPSLR